MKLLVATHNRGKLREFDQIFQGMGLELLSLDDMGITWDVPETGATFEVNARLKAETYGAATGLATLADDSGLEVDALGGAPGVYSARYGGPASVSSAPFGVGAEHASVHDRSSAGLFPEGPKGQDFRAAVPTAENDGPAGGSSAPFGVGAEHASLHDRSSAGLFPEGPEGQDSRAAVPAAESRGPALTSEQRYELVLEKLRGVPPERRTARFYCVIALAVPGKPTVTVDGEVAGVIASEPRGEGGFGYDPVFWLPQYACTMAELPAETKNRISHRARAAAKLAGRLKAEG